MTRPAKATKTHGAATPSRTTPARATQARTTPARATQARATGRAPSGDIAAIEQQLGILMRRGRAHAATMARTLHPGLDAAGAGVLVAVADGIHRAAELATHFGVDKAAISRQLRTLEDLGLLRRVLDPADARAWRLELTRAGTRAMDASQAQRRRATKELVAGWTGPELNRLAADLTRLNNALTG